MQCALGAGCSGILSGLDDGERDLSNFSRAARRAALGTTGHIVEIVGCLAMEIHVHHPSRTGGSWIAPTAPSKHETVSNRRPLLWLVLFLGCAGSNDSSTAGETVMRDAATPRNAAVSDSACRTSTRPTVTSEGFDALTIGASVSTVTRACRVVQDTLELGSEAMPEHRVYVQFGSDTVVATVDSGRIWRIAVETPSLRTSDSLSVGTTLGKILASGKATGLVGEGSLFVQTQRHCGLSFRLQRDLTQAELGTVWTDSALRRLPGSTPVAEILIVGCRQWQ
jgi:hypothetical protein